MFESVCGISVVLGAIALLAGVGCSIVKHILHAQDDHIICLERNNGKLRKEKKKLTARLEEKDAELRKANSALSAVRHLLSVEYGREIARLKEELAEAKCKCCRLETLLEQKWNEAKI